MAIDHARIAPSSLERTVWCPGWIQLADALPPEPESDDSKEGTAAHEVSLRMFQKFPTKLGHLLENGVKVTQEMLDGADLWIATIFPEAICEQRIPKISRIHPTLCWGTPDGWYYDGATKTLYVWDYKFGHRFVEVFFNWQFIAYVVGLLEMLGLPDLGTHVVCTVVQPRSYHPQGPVRTWKFFADDIRAEVNIAMQAAVAAVGSKPTTEAGAWCTDCPAVYVCTTVQSAGAVGITMAGRPEPHHLTGPALAYELMLLDKFLGIMEARQTGLQEQAKSMLARGEVIPGVSLERGQAKLYWHDDVSVDEVQMLGTVMGKNLLKPPELITPTQAINKGIAAEMIGVYAHRPLGKPKLTLDPDNINARKAFWSK